MSTAVVPVKKVQLPAAFAKLQSVEAFSELTTGVVSGFPIISYRGKVWRVRKAGKEESYTNEDGDAMPSIEVVFVRSNPHLSKIYYEAAFEEGSTAPPRCWSADSVKPDPTVTNPIAKSCGACKFNQWGSGRPSPSGGKTRACSDSRRIAVAFRHEMETKGKDATLFLLRIPPGSLNPLKDYAEKVLAPRGIYPFAVFTKIGFDAQVAHPKLTFKATQLFDDELAESVLALRESDEAGRILAEADEFAVAGTTPEADHEPAEEAPVAASASKKKATPRPAAEEEVDEEPVAPPPKKKAAPVVEEDEEPVAPPPKKKAAAPAKGGDFDDMLNSILSS
ncbi:MAG: hypothetical protein HC793_00395 [Aquincola sp.]|nr:hypothetical protein [Aquincola sp.]